MSQHSFEHLPAEALGQSSLGMSTVESHGDVSLHVSVNGYYYFDDDGAVVPLSNRNGPIGPDTYPWLDLLSVEENGSGGYLIIWENRHGNYIEWPIEGTGVRRGPGLRPDEQTLPGRELFYDHDLNGDGTTGYARGPVTLIEDEGDVTLNVGQDGYYYFSHGERNILLTKRDVPIGPDTFAASDLLSVEPDGAGGYRGIWKNIHGDYAEWAIDDTGARTGRASIPTDDTLPSYEEFYDHDLNGDGVKGDGPTLVTLIEDRGDVSLHVGADGNYYFDHDGAVVPLSNRNGPIGPDTYPRLDLLSVEENGSGGYQVIWENIYGDYIEWPIEGTGVRRGPGLRPDEQTLPGRELFYEHDLSGDGVIGYPPPAPGDKIFAPYIDVTLGSVQSVIDLITAAEVDAVTLAFLASGGQDQIIWGTWQNFRTSEQVQQLVSTVQQSGLEVIVSVGGYIATMPAATASSVEALTATYQSVLDTYSVNRLDFDVEGANLNDSVANTLRVDALKSLQATNPDLEISFTLPVVTDGLPASCLALLQEAHNAGLRIDVVNIMTMNYGPWYATGDAGADAIAASQSTIAQLQAMGMDAELLITPMIGINDVVAERFELQDAQEVVDFALTNDSVVGVSMWSLHRDNDDVLDDVTPISSGIPQDDFAFSEIFRSVGDASTNSTFGTSGFDDIA